MKKILLFFLLGGFLSLPLSARHLIGGVITYECLGNGDYEFTMKIYRDCNCTNCADFDPQAPISIYECGTSVNCATLGQNPRFLIYVPLQSKQNIPPPDYPCLIEPDVCVEEGLYQWRLSDYGISLPQSNESYHITYQRCCRNVTINNLFRPDDQGATYTVQITPAAQRLCNNSPAFDSFPPTVICAGTPVDFDHSATDPDGDQLVYELCAPLQGGGPILGGVDYNSCLGAQPDPPCPPPYSQVNFILGTYSPLEPMGGDPPVTIDANTGLITGVPVTQGQFVVGVCVTEYRNGVALSRISRDFQFNVEDCDPTVVARVAADEVLNGTDFLIRSCGEPTIQMQNESFQQIYIDEFGWSFDIDGQTQTFDQWNPQITFPDTGTYSGNLILNPGTECGDTARIIVRIFPEIFADFGYSYDTCVSGPVIFSDQSRAPTTITDWEWNFGDGNFSTDQNPEHLYRIPGSIPVSLEITDENECDDIRTRILPYFPVPRLIVISPSTALGCQPLEVFFDNLSFPIDDSYEIRWDFGDGNTSDAISPTHVFEQEGLFSVGVDIVSPIGCQTDTFFPDLIFVEGAPIADFDYSPSELNSFNRTVNFEDQSLNSIRWDWTFSAYATSRELNPVFTFPDTGRQQVRLIVTHPSGCRDTAFALLDIKPEVRYYLPNAFTPNNDGSNEFYRGVGIMEGATNFQMTIWNRWGELIFETDDPETGWNGRKYNTGEDSPNGVYMVLVTFNGPRGETYSYQSFATLIR